MYSWGRIGNHHLVLTCLPAGRDSTIDAATTAQSLCSSLPHIRLVLLVGIGSGVPSTVRDIRLGNVVVSEPDGDGRSPGVIQYDRLRADGPGLTATGTLNKPPSEILSVVAFLKSQHERRDSRIPEILESMLERIPKMKESGYGGLGLETSRTPRRNCVRPLLRPEIHYGTIASGNSIVQDAETRDTIVKQTTEQTDCSKIFCLDLEAAGLMDDFPCLTIRGISDLADGWTSEVSKRYAAATAGAYAKELLLHMDPRHLRTCKPLLESLLERVQQVSDKLTTEQLCKFLDPFDDFDPHQNAREARAQHTATWILETQDFQKWELGTAASSSRCLWINGPPGSGKTIVCSSIIDHLKERTRKNAVNESIALAYYYFSSESAKSQAKPYESFLRSVIWQVTERGQQAALEDLCEKKQLPSVQELEDVLVTLLKRRRQVYLVVDALDECPLQDADVHNRKPRKDVLRGLAALCQKAPRISLLILSRADIEMKEGIQMAGLRPVSYAIDEQATNHDIAVFLDQQLSGINSKALEELTTENRARIRENLLSRANGMFQWVACMISEMEKLLLLDDSDIIEALNEFRPNLEQTYQRMLVGIPESEGTWAIIQGALRWIAFSLQPLTLGMLCEACAIERGRWQQVDEQTAHKQARQILRKLSALVRTVTSRRSRRGRGVVVYPDDREFVVFTHASVREYLLSQRITESDSKARDFALHEWQAHNMLARTCFECIKYCADAFRDETIELSEKKSLSRLLPYALCHAMEHQKMAENSEGFTGETVETSQNSIVTSARLCQEVLSEGNRLWSFVLGNDWIQCASLPDLHRFSWWGLPHSLANHLQRHQEVLLDQIVSFEKLNRERIELTALICAVCSTSLQTFETLLEGGAGTDLAVADKALFWAASSNQLTMVHRLLKKGADPSTALSAACEEGNTDVAKKLLREGANPRRPSALIGASSGGHEQTVRLLLDAGADVDPLIPGDDCRTPLHAAAEGCHASVMILLEAGADVDARDAFGKTATDIVEANCNDFCKDYVPDPQEPEQDELDYLDQQHEIFVDILRCLESYRAKVQNAPGGADSG